MVRGSELLWQRCDMLFTSGFVDNDVFYAARHRVGISYNRPWNTASKTAEIPKQNLAQR